MNKEKTKKIIEKGRTKIKELKDKKDKLTKEFIRISEEKKLNNIRKHD